MFRVSLRKIPKRIVEGIANLKVPLATPVVKHVKRKALFVEACLAIIVVLGIIPVGFDSGKPIAYTSSVKGFGAGIYWDQACTDRTLSLNWGSIEADTSSNLTVYVKNEINSGATLSLETSSWSQSMPLDYLSLNWNYSGQVLSAGQVIPLELTLTVFPTTSGITNFSFNTTITTTEG
jgi:hypothetical protein